MSGVIQKYHVSKNLLNVSMDNSIVYSDYSQYTHYSITNQTITCKANAAAFFAIPFECGENETFTLSGTNTPFGAVRIRAYSDLPVARDDYYISPQVWSQTVYGSFTKTFITPTDTKYILIEIYHDPQYGEWTLSNFMVNTGETAKPYEPYDSEVWHDIPYRRYETATDTVTTLPVTLYTDGQPIAANLFDYKVATYGTWTNSNGSTILAGYAARSASLNAETITVSCNGETKPYSYSIVWLDGNNTFISREHVGSASMIALPQTFTPPNDAVKYYMQVANGSDTSNPITESQLASYKIMLNTGSTALPYQPYALWVMKGNTKTSGNPSPQNPITIDGVGNITVNLLDKSKAETNCYYNNSDVRYQSNYHDESDYIPVTQGQTYTLYTDKLTTSNFAVYVNAYDTSKVFSSNVLSLTAPNGYNSFTAPITGFVRFNYLDRIGYTKDTMFYKGSSQLPYEPYGKYKVSITSNGTALSPVYLSQQLINLETVEIADTLASSGTATYNTYKLVLTGNESWYDDALPKGDTYSYRMIAPYIYDVGNTVGYDAICTHFAVGAYYAASVVGVQHSSRNLYFRNTQTTLANWQQWLADQYAAGTPVTVYYRVATPTTEAVTVPTITTTGGTATIDVDTIVKPSEIDLTYHGWHEHQPKKKSANLWNEDYTGISGTMKYNAIYVGDGEFTLSSNIVNNNYSYIFFLAGRVASGASTGTNDVYEGLTRTVTAVNGYVTIAFRSTASYSPESYNTMLNLGSTALPYEPYWK